MTYHRKLSLEPQNYTQRYSGCNYCHCRRGPCDENFRTIILNTEDIGFTEVHVCTGFYDTSNGTQALAPSLAEVGAFELSRYGMLVRSYQREPCKARCHVGDCRRNPSMHKAQLLLVFGAELDLGHNMSRLDEREHAADVLHELLTLQVINDRLPEVGVLKGEFHVPKLARFNVNYT